MNRTFSIVIPSFQRPDKAELAVNSVFQQGYDNVEVILVNDGSHPEFDGAYNKFVDDWQRKRKDLIYIKQRRQQRLIARNIGMSASRNEWIGWMDDDDEYAPKFFDIFNKLLDGNPNFLVAGGAAQFYAKDRITPLRKLKTFIPDKKEDGTYKDFNSGTITTGQFIFSKSCLDVTGYLIHTSSYGDFAVSANIPNYGAKEKDDRHDKPWIQVLGNPWGEDFYLYYKLSRYFPIIATDEVVLKKNCRH